VMGATLTFLVKMVPTNDRRLRILLRGMHRDLKK
jgi:hypothetical protein